MVLVQIVSPALSFSTLSSPMYRLMILSFFQIQVRS
jgi:hypothetical protein